MLDQKDQVKIEQSTDDSESCPSATNPPTTTLPTDSQQITLNDAKLSFDLNQSPSNKNNNPLLNDHDYCSPNKDLCQKTSKVKRDLTETDEQSASTDNQGSQATTLTASECCASTSTTPSKKIFDSQIRNKNFNGQTIMGDAIEHVDDGNLSNSSSSSSPLSSDDSNDLVIADPRPKSLAPKDTPSVSRPKAGRRPSTDVKPDLMKQVQQARQRRPRQNASVTDKSQWITGEDQVDTALSEHFSADRREKRQRKEVHDPDFSHFTSSDYSSSDAESDDSDDDENDPNKPWCLCMKPHGGNFMICCDICEYWYHGMCVGVTEQMSKRFEREKKEWFCSECQTHLQNGTPRQAIPPKVIKKEKKRKSGKTGKRGRGRPRKPEGAIRESARLSSRIASKRPSLSLDSRLSTRRNPNKSEAARSESFEQFENEKRLKELIKERKASFFHKRKLAEQQKLARISELGKDRLPVTANLGTSLNSLATSTSSPNMSNLPLNIKSELEDRAKPNIVLQINTKKDGEVTAVVKSKKRKHSESSDQPVDDLFMADPIQIGRKTKSSSTSGPGGADAGQSTSSKDRRSSNGSKSEKSSNEQPSNATPKKKRKDSESSASASFGSKDIAKKFQEILESRAKQLKDSEQPDQDAFKKLALDIEAQLNECFKEGSPKYLNKYRSLIFNFTKNNELVRNVLTGEIQPSRLVRMSPDEMAPHELAKWRERHSKHEIELIKHSAQLAAQQVIVKKTHKGEEVISAPLLNDPDDPTAETNNQEPPTTPTKTPNKELRSSSTGPTLYADTISGSTNGATTPIKLSIQLPSQKENPQTPISLTESLPFLDTTEEHDIKKHIFDINCKICTKQQLPDAVGENSTNVNAETVSALPDSTSKIEEPTVKQNEPKRLRVSIETSLDLNSLSKLRDQPLIKPSEKPAESVEYSPSRLTPNVDSNSNDSVEEEEELYDPEIMLATAPNAAGDTTGSVVANDQCPWSGSITMPEVGKFSATIRPISGDPSFMRADINQKLLVCGRIRPEQVHNYIKKLRATSKNPIVSVEFNPKSEDRTSYNNLFDYLYTRNRFGVIQNSSHSQILRDFYIIPIHEGGGLPEVLKPVQGPGLNRARTNCLVGLMVKAKRPTSSLSGISGGASNTSAQPVIASLTQNK